MKQMRVEQLFAEGKYMVIYLSPETAVYDELGYYLWNKDGKNKVADNTMKNLLLWAVLLVIIKYSTILKILVWEIFQAIQ